MRTIAFPSISTGVYGFPVDRASRIALKTIHEAILEDAHLNKVTVVCFDEATHRQYQNASVEILGE
jgi:O-acetyl-ADP-ribose deacetylase (regulator of RNase III)